MELHRVVKRATGADHSSQTAANVSRATTIAPTSGIVTEAMMDCTKKVKNTVDC